MYIRVSRLLFTYRYILQLRYSDSNLAHCIYLTYLWVGTKWDTLTYISIVRIKSLSLSTVLSPICFIYVFIKSTSYHFGKTEQQNKFDAQFEQIEWIKIHLNAKQTTNKYNNRWNWMQNWVHFVWAQIIVFFCSFGYTRQVLFWLSVLWHTFLRWIFFPQQINSQHWNYVLFFFVYYYYY